MIAPIDQLRVLRLLATIVVLLAGMAGCGNDAVFQQINDAVSGSKSAPSEPAGLISSEEQGSVTTLPSSGESTAKNKTVDQELSFRLEELNLIHQVNQAVASVVDEPTALAAAKTIDARTSELVSLIARVEKTPKVRKFAFEEFEQHDAAQPDPGVELIRENSILGAGSNREIDDGSSALSKRCRAARPQLLAAVEKYRLANAIFFRVKDWRSGMSPHPGKDWQKLFE